LFGVGPRGWASLRMGILDLLDSMEILNLFGIQWMEEIGLNSNR